MVITTSFLQCTKLHPNLCSRFFGVWCWLYHRNHSSTRSRGACISEKSTSSAILCTVTWKPIRGKGRDFSNNIPLVAFSTPPSSRPHMSGVICFLVAGGRSCDSSWLCALGKEIVLKSCLDDWHSSVGYFPSALNRLCHLLWVDVGSFSTPSYCVRDWWFSLITSASSHSTSISFRLVSLLVASTAATDSSFSSTVRDCLHSTGTSKDIGFHLHG